MKLAQAKLKELCRRRGWTLSRLLAVAEVSRNAYYSLARKESLLPRSLVAIADTLEVSPGAFIEEAPAAERYARRLLRRVETVIDREPSADPEDVRHTLVLLEEAPIERLRRALRRGRYQPPQ